MKSALAMCGLALPLLDIDSYMDVIEDVCIALLQLLLMIKYR